MKRLLICLAVSICVIGLHSCDNTIPDVEEEGDEPVSVTGVALWYVNFALAIGETVGLEPAIEPWNATDQTVTWSTSDDSIIAVDSQGQVTGIDLGTAVITVTTNDGRFTAQLDALVIAGGNLDVTFNSVGYITIDDATGLGSGNDVANDISTDPSGRFVVAGESYQGLSNPDMALVRVLENGELDTSFSDDGIFTHDNAAGSGAGSYDTGAGLTFYTGRIYVAGTSSTPSDTDVVLWAFDDSDGSLLEATVFSDTGDDHDDWVRSVTHHVNGSDEGIVICGYRDGGLQDDDLCLWRYTRGGSVDTTFGTGGRVTHHNAAGGDGRDTGEAVALGSDGKLLVAGFSATTLGTEGDMVVWRYSPEGDLDTTFGTSGFARFTGNPMSGDTARGITPDGAMILVTGWINNEMAVWRFNPDGSLDESFGTMGYVTDPGPDVPGSSYAVGHDIVLDWPVIYVAGYKGNSMVIWRFFDDGTLDTAFGDDGHVHHVGAAGGSGPDKANAMVIDDEGRVVVVGYSYNGSNNDIAIWRFK